MTRLSTPVFTSGLSRLFPALLVGAALSFSPLVALAQDAGATPATVVATVGGVPVTEADLAFAAEDLGQQLAKVPQDQIRAVLLTQLIELKLMAKAGHDAKLEDDELYKLRLSYLSDRAMRRAYLAKALNETITPEAIKAEYDKQIAAMPAEDEIHARHILVTTEDDAKAIKAALDGGADFDALAKEKSIEPGAKQSGGDLGYFKAGAMVKPFADAAFAMKVGEISNPVQTQFGWHIIKIEDRRPAAKPTLEEMSQQIDQQLSEAKYRELFDQLKGTAQIEIPDAALKAQVDAQLKPAK